MANLSSPGIGSGLDVRGIVAQLVELEKRPLTTVQLRTSAAQLRLSTVGQIRGQLAALDDALRGLTLDSSYNALKVNSSSEAVSGSISGAASSGVYSVQVLQVARGQVARSDPINTGAPVGAGQLTIALGRWDSGPSFTPGADAPVVVSVSATDTLADVANKINASTDRVRAAVVQDGSQQRLVVRSMGTGVDQGFRIQVSDADGNDTDAAGLSRLAYDPAAGTAGLTLTQSAQNTRVDVDGVEVSSANQTVSGVIPGVTLNVKSVTTAPVTVSVERDPAVLRKALDAFVQAYNQLNTTLSEATRYDAKTRQAGPLQGDSTIVTLQSALRRLLGTPSTNPLDTRTWSDIGVRQGRDGSLSVDGAAFETAQQDPQALRSLLVGSSDAPGLARRLRDFVGGALASDGRIGLKTKAIENELQRLNEQAQRITEKAARTEERLLAQYARLDANLGRLNALGQYVNQQVAAWNKPSK